MCIRSIIVFLNPCKVRNVSQSENKKQVDNNKIFVFQNLAKHRCMKHKQKTVLKKIGFRLWY